MNPGRHSQRPHGESESLSKAEARRRGLEARDALTVAGRRLMSAAVCARAALLPELAEAGTVMSFASFRSELYMVPLADWVLAAGKTLCLPRVLGGRRMAAFLIDDPALDWRPAPGGSRSRGRGCPK